MKIFLRFLLFFVHALMVNSAWAVPIVAYLPGSGSSVSPTIEATGVSGDALARGAGINLNVGGDFNSNGWNSTNSADAIANDEFLTWGFAAVNAFDLTTLEIRYDRSNTGPTALVIDLAVNGGSFQTVFTDPDSVSITGEENTVDLTAFGLTGVTCATFRLAAFGASSTAGTFDIENTVTFDGTNGLVVSGTVVPVPAAAWLFGSALGLLGWMIRKGSVK